MVAIKSRKMKDKEYHWEGMAEQFAQNKAFRGKRCPEGRVYVGCGWCGARAACLDETARQLGRAHGQEVSALLLVWRTVNM